jgi:pyroglutamyl-peptidase
MVQRSPTVLLTGFDAFGGELINPSWLAVKALHGRQIAGHRLVAAQLPTVFDESLQALRTQLLQHRPALTICVGQAGGRSAISLERVAININDARIADNAGTEPVDTPVLPGGPTAYFTTLPIKSILQALQQDGVAAEVSQTAGTFVCNHVFYGLMHALATQRGFKKSRGGFIHVPFLPEQGAPSMPLAEITRGLRIAVRCALETKHDALISAGAVQ